MAEEAVLDRGNGVPPRESTGTGLVLGPLLRYVGTTTATVWVETDAPTVVEILGHRANTFQVLGHHYALVLIEGLAPGSVNPYEVRLQGRTVWPPTDGRPESTIRTREGERQARLIFGSCRVGAPEVPPYTLAPSDDPKGLGVDALWAYSQQLQTGSAEWPDGLLLLGDQVYVDEVPPETAAFIRGRRNIREPPGEEVADFEEYTVLFRESWSDPDIRWLLATVPSTMIFDDHEVSDDWNISQAWVQEMRALSWWDERITSAFMAYWIYQHLGNLSPPELAEETLFDQVLQDDDAGPRLREFARKCDRESAASRWAYYRDFGRSRLLVIDSRAARVLAEGRRDMVDADEWDWIAEHAHGSFDHLILATTLPAFAPSGIHDLEAWNEAVCDGCWGSGAARLGERLRRAVDLEHWAAFQRSFEQLVDLLQMISRGLGGEPPATVTILSGDVHSTYIAEIDLGECGGSSRAFQVVCSPFRNPLKPFARRVVKATGSRRAAAIFSRLARACGVPPPSVSWSYVAPRTYENSIGELELDGPKANVTIYQARARAGSAVLVPLGTHELSSPPGIHPAPRSRSY
jgi:PhoD-like phosphatase